MKILDNIWTKGKEFLGVPHPIIAGGMTWISNYEFCKATADAGIFPVLAAGNMPPDLFEREVDRCIEGFSSPFAVNLITISENFDAHFEILQSKKVPFVVFAGSFPRKRHITRMKAAGKKTVSFASTRSIAQRQIDWGIDALVLEGSEAGGHIGHVSLTVLLQQVLFEFEGFPIFVAGGIATGRMMAHMLLMGAWGVQMGTRFVMSTECPAHSGFKQAFVQANAREAIATPQYDRRLHVVAVRALKNRATDDFGRLQLNLLQRIEEGTLSSEQARMEAEKFWVGALREGVINGNADRGSLMAGQSVGLMNDIKPMKQIVTELIDDAEIELGKVKSRF